MPDLWDITFVELKSLLCSDGWEEKLWREGEHILLYKKTEGQTQVVILLQEDSPIPKTTLDRILGEYQTGIGYDGLKALSSQTVNSR